MIARITSPIPGPSSLHRPRRKTLRVVARGVVFIQRMKYVSLLFSSYNLPHRVRKGAQARFGAPNVRPSLPSELRSKTCGVEGSSRQDCYSVDQVVVHSSPPHYIRSYYYSTWLNSLVSLHGSTTTTVPICMYNRLYVIYPLQHLWSLLLLPVIFSLRCPRLSIPYRPCPQRILRKNLILGVIARQHLLW
jgi:hypothetical protein